MIVPQSSYAERAAIDSQAIVDSLDALRPRLTDCTYQHLGQTVTGYLADINGPEATGEKLPELSRTQTIVDEVIAQNESDLTSSEGLGKYKEQALKSLVWGYWRAGIIDYTAHPILVEAHAAVAKQVDDVAEQLQVKHDLFVYMMQSFSDAYAVIGYEITERKVEAMQAMVDKISKSQPVPPLRKRGDWKLKQAWETSKSKLIDPSQLPTDEQIITDYFKSAAAAYRRSIYGERELELTRGIQSDPTDQIDAYQRRHYDELGWRIALTAQEWADHQVGSQIHEYLHSKGPVRDYLGSIGSPSVNFDFTARTNRQESHGGKRYAGKSRAHKRATRIINPEQTTELHGRRVKVQEDIEARMRIATTKSHQNDIEIQQSLLELFRETLAGLPDEVVDSLLLEEVRGKVVRKITKKLHPDTFVDAELTEEQQDQLNEMQALLSNFINTTRPAQEGPGFKQ